MEVFLDDAGTGLEQMKRISRNKEERRVGAEAKGRREEEGRHRQRFGGQEEGTAPKRGVITAE